MTRHLQLSESDPAVSADLSASEAVALASTDLVTVTGSPSGNTWEVAPTRKVGVVTIGDLQVTVRPKLPVARLLFLMGYAQTPSFWRDHDVWLDPELGLPDALGESFRRLAAKATEQGLLHGYKQVDSSGPVLRGRLREPDQLSRRYGQLLPLEVRYNEFTVDIAENQLLLAATLRLLRMPAISGQVRHRLQRVRLQLADVTVLRRGDMLPVWRPSRLNARYQPALRLAELILGGDSFEQRVGGLHVSGFTVDMWRVFEDFTCVALGEALSAYGGRTDLQYRSHLDRDARVPIRPDLVWSFRGTAAVVVDAKYKAERPAGFPQADLYQMLAYCTVLGIDDGHLIYASGNEQPTVHAVEGSGVRIHCHTLDLDRSPADLLAQVSRLAKTLVATPRLLEGLIR